ncbi:MAG: GntR family transcriptional regulator [Lachnospiraceae bacterium]|nr:GntR family transcriptional regulator [Candidatus Equihabitans merdae]
MDRDFIAEIDEYLPLREVVYNTLRKAILRGEFQPGERLMEISLSNKLGVSRTPVREAIRQLESDGLVTIIPRKGAQVARITSEEMYNVLEIRKCLELWTAEKACSRITEEGIVELEEAEKEFEKRLHSGDITELAEADEKFHNVIYNAAGNPRLVQLMYNLREQMYRFRVEYLKDKNSLDLLVQEHRGIIDAVKNRDGEAAVRFTENHINNQQLFIDKNIEEINQDDGNI